MYSRRNYASKIHKQMIIFAWAILRKLAPAPKMENPIFRQHKLVTVLDFLQ